MIIINHNSGSFLNIIKKNNTTGIDSNNNNWHFYSVDDDDDGVVVVGGGKKIFVTLSALQPIILGYDVKDSQLFLEAY